MTANPSRKNRESAPPSYPEEIALYLALLDACDHAGQLPRCTWRRREYRACAACYSAAVDLIGGVP